MAQDNDLPERGSGRQQPVRLRMEWPTIVLAICIYGGWIALTALQRHLAWPVLMAGGGWLIAWHNSLQHEIIHGHPTSCKRLNLWLAAPPLALWLPFSCYRESHLAHHATEQLTDPLHDPESRYRLPADGGRRARWVAWCNATLLGRLLLGPWLDAIRFWRREARLVLQNHGSRRWVWLRHLVGIGLIVLWLEWVCGMSLLRYIACFVYPGVALSLIRSFAEHQPAPWPAHRVAVVEKAPFLGLLFLNNNLHVAHHDQPWLAWYDLPSRYARRRAEFLASNGGLVYRGYGEVFARYLFRPIPPRAQALSGQPRLGL